jgi:hypothetical protein
MTEVAEFLSRNPDIEKDCRDLMEGHDRLSDVWAKCYRSDCMLELLNDWIDEFLQRPYPHYEETIANCSEGLEKYIDSLSEMIKGSDQERARARSENFSYKRAVEHFRKEVDSGKLCEIKGATRHFQHVLFVARKASHYILSDERGRFQVHKDCDEITGEETARAEYGDENELKLTIMKQQADLLRASVSNPFALF